MTAKVRQIHVYDRSPSHVQTLLGHGLAGFDLDREYWRERLAFALHPGGDCVGGLKSARGAAPDAWRRLRAAW